MPTNEPANEAATEASLDAELTELLGSTPTDEAVTEPATETPVTPLETPVAEAVAEPTIEEKLKAIEDADTPAPVDATAPNADHQKVLTLFPTPAIAEQAQTVINNYSNLIDTLNSGDFGKVEQMFNAWNPTFLDNFMEHVYSQKVASGEWVERWIKDKEGNPVVNNQLTALQKQIQGLEARLKGEDQQRLTAQNQRALNEAKEGYNAHITRLFDEIKLPASDRKWVANEITARINADPTTLQAILNGNAKMANKHFKAAVQEYVQRDKEVSQIKADTTAAQDKHKQPLQSAQQPVGAITDEAIKALPKAARGDAMDAKLEQDLGAFLGKSRRG